MKLNPSNLAFALALLIAIVTAPTCRSCEHRGQTHAAKFSES